MEIFSKKHNISPLAVQETDIAKSLLQDKIWKIFQIIDRPVLTVILINILKIKKTRDKPMVISNHIFKIKNKVFPRINLLMRIWIYLFSKRNLKKNKFKFLNKMNKSWQFKTKQTQKSLKQKWKKKSQNKK